MTVTAFQALLADRLGVPPACQELLAGFPPKLVEVCSSAEKCFSNWYPLLLQVHAYSLPSPCPVPMGVCASRNECILEHAAAQLLCRTYSHAIQTGHSSSSQLFICSAVAIKCISHAIIIPGTSQWGYARPQKAGSSSSRSSTRRGSCSPSKHKTTSGPQLKRSSSFSTAGCST